MDKVLQAIHDLKADINTHFATKADLAEWKLDMYEHTSELLEKHKANCNSGKLSKKTIAALVAAIVALSSGVTALAQLL